MVLENQKRRILVMVLKTIIYKGTSKFSRLTPKRASSQIRATRKNHSQSGVPRNRKGSSYQHLSPPYFPAVHSDIFPRARSYFHRFACPCDARQSLNHRIPDFPSYYTDLHWATAPLLPALSKHLRTINAT